jgi:hypothetical protein
MDLKMNANQMSDDNGPTVSSAMNMLELLVSEAMGDEGAVTEVLRPSAIVPEEATRLILMELALRDIRNGGLWLAEPSVWRRFDRPNGGPQQPQLLGSIQVAYGTPTRYEITIYRVTVTSLGQAAGWSVESLTDEALSFGGLTLAGCPRADLKAPPKPFRFETQRVPTD